MRQEPVVSSAQVGSSVGVKHAVRKIATAMTGRWHLGPRNSPSARHSLGATRRAKRRGRLRARPSGETLAPDSLGCMWSSPLFRRSTTGTQRSRRGAQTRGLQSRLADPDATGLSSMPTARRPRRLAATARVVGARPRSGSSDRISGERARLNDALEERFGLLRGVTGSLLGAPGR